MDEDTEIGLVDAAKRTLKIDYEFSDVQRSILIQIHQAYLDWDDSGIDPLHNLEAELKKAKEATEKYKLALHNCGIIGRLILSEKVIETALKPIRIFSESIEHDKEIYQKTDPKFSYSPKPGHPENYQMQFYISQMAGWYNELTGEKPRHGNRARFRNLLNECLAAVDLNPIDPSHDIIKSVLKKLGTGPIEAYE